MTGGTFDRTYGGDAGLTDSATISGFRLDKYDVTVGRFRAFVTAWNGGAGWTPPGGSGKHVHLNGGKGLSVSGAPGTYEAGWDPGDNSGISPTNANLTDSSCGSYATWTPTVGSQENLPIDCVNWFEAYAFCIWDGGFLPSAAEAEYAAAGGSQQRLYPWGTTDPGTTSQYAIYGPPNGCYYPNGGSPTCTGVANIAPVGTATLGVGLYGQLDLAGEVWQWELDWQAASYGNPCVDCANLSGGEYIMMRGGYYSAFSALIQSEPEQSDFPESRNEYYWGGSHGFRCARTP